ncbi:MAG: tRNA (guanosine(46)-N7)-methyltransferase TrmB [Oscillospiraceae bacterium]|nr:tRNA (guanosine(46)-N7)-methyltransferase TrmB [Oscillospiraceae bacterium]
MRLRNRPWAAGELDACPYYIKDFAQNHGKWHEAFANGNSIWLELGCGKGLYIAATAPKRPDINFIAADIKGLMLAYARRYIEAAFAAVGKSVDNVKLLSVDASRIQNAFSPEDKVQRIIINFCNPWPKPHHYKRRLIHTKQLLLYREFLADDGEIYFKTDSDMLYEAAPAYFEEAGYEILEDLADYYSRYELDEAALTEHERKFLGEGLPIHFMRAKKKAQ